MSDELIECIIEGLLHGKRPPYFYLQGIGSEMLATALSAKIDNGVAPSRCAHAMCGSAAAGNVAVIRMLSKRPITTFNKAYDFGEPLRRACRAFTKAVDPDNKQAIAQCAKLIVAAKGDLNQPDKYLKSGVSAAGLLRKCGTDEALSLLKELELISQDLKENTNEGIDIATESAEDAKIINAIKSENKSQSIKKRSREESCQEEVERMEKIKANVEMKTSSGKRQRKCK